MLALKRGDDTPIPVANPIDDAWMANPPVVFQRGDRYVALDGSIIDDASCIDGNKA